MLNIGDFYQLHSKLAFYLTLKWHTHKKQRNMKPSIAFFVVVLVPNERSDSLSSNNRLRVDSTPTLALTQELARRCLQQSCVAFLSRSRTSAVSTFVDRHAQGASSTGNKQRKSLYSLFFSGHPGFFLSWKFERVYFCVTGLYNNKRIPVLKVLGG